MVRLWRGSGLTEFSCSVAPDQKVSLLLQLVHGLQHLWQQGGWGSGQT